MLCFIFTIFYPYFSSSAHSGFKPSQATAFYRPNSVRELTPKTRPEARLTNPLNKTDLYLPKILLKSLLK